jgi:hypothetical protein
MDGVDSVRPFGHSSAPSARDGRSPGISRHSPKDRSSHASRTNKMERGWQAAGVAELRIFDRYPHALC